MLSGEFCCFVSARVVCLIVFVCFVCALQYAVVWSVVCADVCLCGLLLFVCVVCVWSIVRCGVFVNQRCFV